MAKAASARVGGGQAHGGSTSYLNNYSSSRSLAAPAAAPAASAAPRPALMSTGSASYSAPSYSTPLLPMPSSPVNIDTSVNPLEQDAYSRWKSYDAGLADNTNAEITRELQRARDEISVGMEREGEAAVGRGADAGLFRTRRLESGKRDLHMLQGRLADAALGRREGALSGLTSAAGQAASGQRTLHLGAQAARLAEDRLQLDRAEAQQRLNDAPYRRMLDMMDSAARYSSLMGDASTSSILGYS